MKNSEKFSVVKTFEISYAHRLLNYNGKCENLHGHNGKIEIEISTYNLNNEEMVMDFTEIKEKAGRWLNENLDHKTILSRKDPLVKALKKNHQKLFLTDRNPTAEILCQIIYENLNKLGIKAETIKFWETDSSVAIYKKEEL
jgi:6-pyruvoyltetrahydropterin/6-carboxytetrahydropterin synthase